MGATRRLGALGRVLPGSSGGVTGGNSRQRFGSSTGGGIMKISLVVVCQPPLNREDRFLLQLFAGMHLVAAA